MLWGNTPYCVKFSGEDMSRYSNKFESVGLRKCPHYQYLTKKSGVTITDILQSLAHTMAKQLA